MLEVCILPISYSVVTEEEQEANPRYRFMEAQIYSLAQAERKSLSRLTKVQRGPFKSYIVLCQSQANLVTNISHLPSRLHVLCRLSAQINIAPGAVFMKRR